MKALSLYLLVGLLHGFDTGEGPGPRNAHSMVYHEGEEKIYLFGGASHAAVLGDLWTWGKGVWQKVETQEGPSPRTFACLTYEPDGDRLMLYGGNRVLFGKGPEPGNILGDTWQFSSGSWQQLEPTNSPPPRAESAIAYDRKRARLVLFGGYYIDDSGDYVKLGDTWEYYEEDWHLAADNGPTPRHGVMLWYDPSEERVMLFGGSTEDRQYGTGTGQTWTWEAGSWQRVVNDQPTGIFNPAFAVLDTEVIRFGGWDGAQRVDQTWTFADGHWSELVADESPPARNHAAMVYNGVEEQLILFGGHDGRRVFSDTWSWRGGGWHLLMEGAVVVRERNGH